MDASTSYVVTSPKPAAKTMSAFGLSRAELMALVFLVVVSNAIIPNVVNGIADEGIGFALLNTFEISAIVWFAVIIAVKYLLGAPVEPLRAWDRWVALLLLLCSFAPLGPATWVILAAFGIYLIHGSDELDNFHRAGWVILAITVPMFWSKRVFNFFSEYFLAADATLVSSVMGTHRIANLVSIPGASGYLQIAAPCSSIANVSLAVLCWTLFTQTASIRWQLGNLFWCLAACLSVVGINITRISLIGFYPQHYELLHGPVGFTTTSWITVIVIFFVCFFGVSRGRVKFV